MLEDIDAPFLHLRTITGSLCTLHGESFYTQQSMQSVREYTQNSISISIDV